MTWASEREARPQRVCVVYILAQPHTQVYTHTCHKIEIWKRKTWRTRRLLKILKWKWINVSFGNGMKNTLWGCTTWNPRWLIPFPAPSSQCPQDDWRRGWEVIPEKGSCYFKKRSIAVLQCSLFVWTTREKFFKVLCLNLYLFSENNWIYCVVFLTGPP